MFLASNVALEIVMRVVLKIRSDRLNKIKTLGEI